MTLAVYRRRNTTTQQQQHFISGHENNISFLAMNTWTDSIRPSLIISFLWCIPYFQRIELSLLDFYITVSRLYENISTVTRLMTKLYECCMHSNRPLPDIWRSVISSSLGIPAPNYLEISRTHAAICPSGIRNFISLIFLFHAVVLGGVGNAKLTYEWVNSGLTSHKQRGHQVMEHRFKPSSERPKKRGIPLPIPGLIVEHFIHM